MAKQKDVGLEFLQKMNIRAAREPMQLQNDMSAKFGAQVVRDYIKSIQESSSKYSAKNQNPEMAVAYTAGFDADLIRNACNWVSAHADLFGDRILEVGADCGLMTCFLASAFPEKKIVAIDREESGLKVAKALVEKMDLQNVEFVCSELSQLKTEPFDTVFAMRTLFENCPVVKEDLFKELGEQAHVFADGLKNFAAALKAQVKPDGRVICLDRLPLSAYCLGLIESMASVGMKLEESLYQEIACTQMGNPSHLSTMVFADGACENVREDALACFGRCFAKDNDISAAGYNGPAAKIMLELKRGELLDGYKGEDIRRNIKRTASLWTHKEDPSTLLFFHGDNRGYANLVFIDISELSIAREKMKGESKAGAQSGATITSLKKDSFGL